MAEIHMNIYEEFVKLYLESQAKSRLIARLQKEVDELKETTPAQGGK